MLNSELYLSKHSRLANVCVQLKQDMTNAMNVSGVPQNRRALILKRADSYKVNPNVVVVGEPKQPLCRLRSRSSPNVADEFANDDRLTEARKPLKKQSGLLGFASFTDLKKIRRSNSHRVPMRCEAKTAKDEEVLLFPAATLFVPGYTHKESEKDAKQNLFLRRGSREKLGYLQQSSPVLVRRSHQPRKPQESNNNVYQRKEQIFEKQMEFNNRVVRQRDDVPNVNGKVKELGSAYASGSKYWANTKRRQQQLTRAKSLSHADRNTVHQSHQPVARCDTIPKNDDRYSYMEGKLKSLTLESFDDSLNSSWPNSVWRREKSVYPIPELTRDPSKDLCVTEL